MAVLNKTNIGYNHINNSKICQDYSLSYEDEKRSIIAVADGHGGSLYVRSDRGSKFACQSLLNVFKKYDYNLLENISNELKDKIKLEVLCEWNKLVEEDISKMSIQEDEMLDLSENQILLLKKNPVVAYGTTLHGVFVIKDIIITLSIGDGGIFLINDYDVIGLNNEEEDYVANLTESLCSDDAYSHITIEVYKNIFSSILVLTDGVVNPYQSYENFTNSFVVPIINKLSEPSGTDQIYEFMKELGEKRGIGDDVSIAIYYKN